MQPEPSELEALKNSALLVKFAAENVKDVKDLSENIVSTIATAWKLQHEDSWGPEIATKFWLAYATLCAIIRPASLDSLVTTEKRIETKKWIWFGKPVLIMAVYRVARHYLTLLLALLGLSLILGFVTATASNLNSELQKLDQESSAVAGNIRVQVDSLWPLFGDDKPLDDAKDDQTRGKISEMRNHLQDLYYLVDKLYQKSQALSRIMGLEPVAFEPGDLSLDTNIKAVNVDLVSHYRTRRDVTGKQQESLIRASMISGYILPVLLGAMGACAYVVRMISDQVRDMTYYSFSQIQHPVRIALGALTGVVIGYGGLALGASLSGAALSFIAGYSIEPVFATIDGIAQKFR